MFQTAVILAGGFGTRLKSVVNDVPKPMAPVNEIPFLTYQLKYLKKYGIRKVIIDKKKAVIESHQHDAGCEKIWAKNGGDKKSCLDKDLVVVIKPGELATYKNTVDILDEMTITNIKRYAMVDLFPAEKTLIEATEGK